MGATQNTRTVTTDIDDEETRRQVVDRLEERYPQTSRADIEDAVTEEFESLTGRPVRDYLAILTERAARKRLKREGKT